MGGDETWFEVKIDPDLARVFQRIVNVHSRIGREKRAELITRLEAAIPGPRLRLGDPLNVRPPAVDEQQP